MARVQALTEPARIVRAAETVSGTVTPTAPGGDVIPYVANGNLTINGPTSPDDGQPLKLRVRANGADRTVTFASGSTPKIVPSTGLTLGPYTVPRGRVLIAALEYAGDRRTSADAADPAWVLTAATVSG